MLNSVTTLHSALYANTERLLTELSNAHLAMSTIEDYQEYFAKAGTLSKNLIHLEESKKALKTRDYIDSQSDLVEAMIRYLDWCHEKGYIQADGIKTLIEKIRTCRLSKVLNDKNFELIPEKPLNLFKNPLTGPKTASAKK